MGSNSLQDGTSKKKLGTSKTETNASKFEELVVKKEKVKLDFSYREIMKEIKSLTYVTDNHNALENLKQRLTEAHDEFAHYILTDYRLVVENS